MYIDGISQSACCENLSQHIVDFQAALTEKRCSFCPQGRKACRERSSISLFSVAIKWCVCFFFHILRKNISLCNWENSVRIVEIIALLKHLYEDGSFKSTSSGVYLKENFLPPLSLGEEGSAVTGGRLIREGKAPSSSNIFITSRKSERIERDCNKGVGIMGDSFPKWSYNEATLIMQRKYVYNTNE